MLDFSSQHSYLILNDGKYHIQRTPIVEEVTYLLAIFTPYSYIHIGFLGVLDIMENRCPCNFACLWWYYLKLYLSRGVCADKSAVYSPFVSHHLLLFSQSSCSVVGKSHFLNIQGTIFCPFKPSHRYDAYFPQSLLSVCRLFMIAAQVSLLHHISPFKNTVHVIKTQAIRQTCKKTIITEQIELYQSVAHMRFLPFTLVTFWLQTVSPCHSSWWQVGELVGISIIYLFSYRS